MTRISNTEHVLLLLRAHLERAARARGKPVGRASDTPNPGALERLRRTTPTSSLSDSEIADALVEALLLEEFGQDLANDPHFLDMSRRVAAIIKSDECSADLLKGAVAQLNDPA